MELMYPFVIFVCLVISIIIFFKRNKKKSEYSVGKKVANTKYVKETEYFKMKMKKYHKITNLIKIISVIVILLTGVLIARPITVQTKNEEKLNRDIIVSLDISTSECDVNLEVIEKFKRILPDIEGDRIGIVLYNTAPIVYCPLTEDYDYIEECFETIQKQLKIVSDNGGRVPVSLDEKGAETTAFWYGGTVDNNEIRGSSLVGDGLAGTIFAFPDLKNNIDRTRIIIFATDNDVAGAEEISLEDACEICNQYKINLYAYCPTTQMNSYTSEEKIAKYKKAVEEKAKGNFYTGNLETATSNIVKEIKETKKTMLKTSKKTIVTDHPEIIFVLILVLFLISIILEKRIKL